MAGGDNDWGLPWELRDTKISSDRNELKKSCELVPVEAGAFEPGFVNGTWFAFASGDAPCSNMAVGLVPATYVVKPDYWDIMVIGCHEDICLEALRPYSVWRDVTKYVGHKGIKIVGSNKPLTFDMK